MGRVRVEHIFRFYTSWPDPNPTFWLQGKAKNQLQGNILATRQHLTRSTATPTGGGPRDQLQGKEHFGRSKQCEWWVLNSQGNALVWTICKMWIRRKKAKHFAKWRSAWRSVRQWLWFERERLQGKGIEEVIQGFFFAVWMWFSDWAT